MLIAGCIAGCDIVTTSAISGKWKFVPGKKCGKPGLIAEYAKNTEKKSGLRTSEFPSVPGILRAKDLSYPPRGLFL
jgi:hypothetical protein